MGALPNTLPSTPKKPATKARKPSKKNEYGRDPSSPSERLRASSDYDRETGYSPFFHAFLADIPRLTSGNSCTILLMTIWAKSAGRGAAKGQKRPEWTQELATEDLAQICRCDVRTIERELVALEKRGLGEVRRPSKGTVECRLKYREWEALPDYKSPVVEIPASDDADVTLDEADEAKPGNQRVTGKKPVRVAAGAMTKPLAVNCGVKTFRYRAEGPVDLDITAVIKAGELVVTSALPASWVEKLENLKSTSSVFNDLTSPPRHGRRGDGANVGRKSAEVNHPRAGELIQLFDPLLAKSAAPLLAMDSVSLLAACEAVGDCDHDHLVKFAINRASSPIRKPSHVKMICAEALQTWNTSKTLDAAGAKRYSKAELDAMVEKERADLARKRAALRGRK